MGKPLKIVLIGAGSREFAKGLVHDLVLETELLAAREVEVALVDIDGESLETMRAYAVHAAESRGARVSFTATTERRDALVGADFVLVSVAVKRMELWEQDFRVPLAYGIPHVYGENGGPGAAFHALRNIKTLMPICADVEKLCPQAWVINFTNPEARILTAILTLTKVKAIGLCHGFYSFRRLATAVLARPEAELDIRTAGINHFYTYYKIAEKASGADLIPEFERRLAADPSVIPPLARYFWERFGVLGYCSDHHIGEYLGFAHEIVGNAWLFGNEGRIVDPGESGVDGRVVFEAWRNKVDVKTYFAEGIAEKERLALSPTVPIPEGAIKSSGELAVPVIADISLDRRRWRPSMNVLNDGGFIENLDRDTAVELPAVVSASGPAPERVGRLPEGFAALVKQQQSVQRLLVRAYAEKSRKLLLQALLVDPACAGRARSVEAMLDHMLRIQAPYLPELR
jgi:alpha-galactosidase